MGSSGEAMNIAHQAKKMNDDDVRRFRDRFQIPVKDDQLDEMPLVKFADGSPELEYMRTHRQELGGYLPQRRTKSESLPVPALEVFAPLLEATAEGREISTTMAFVRMLNTIIRDKILGKRVVPIVPDESRTFGMEGMFRQLGILQEGINEAGGMCDWIAAATSYSTHNVPMLPFYIFYSMFGFQRIGDLAWAAGDMRSRGYLLGGTAGRTTLNGEGLQHEDGHSHLWSAAVPNCISYDPTFSFELAVVIQDGMRRMLEVQEDVYYYVTLMNENYAHPAMPKGVEQDIIKGMYKLKSVGDANATLRVQLLGSGTIFREVIEAADILHQDWGIASDLWGCPSFTELGRNWSAVHRNNLLNSTDAPVLSHVEKCLKDTNGPVIAATDYVRLFPEQIRPAIQHLGRRYEVLGTDGFGRSDTRENLRNFFEVDRRWIVLTALRSLVDSGQLERQKIAEAIKKYDIDTTKPNPMTV